MARGRRNDMRPVPDNDVIAIIRGSDSVQAAVEGLRRQGFPDEDIRVLRGLTAEEQLDSPGKGGVLAPLARAAQGILSEEGLYLDEYRRATEEGAAVLAVHVEDKDQAQIATDILTANHATQVKFFGKFAITEMTLPGEEDETQG